MIKRIKRQSLIIFLIPFIVIAIVIIGIGVKHKMDQDKLQKEMIEIVKSEEAKKVFEEGLKDLDPKAFTKEGIIKNYKIDYDSVTHNPMGGIDVTLYANGNRKLYVFFTLDKDKKDNLVDDGGGNSKELEELLKEGNSNEH